MRVELSLASGTTDAPGRDEEQKRSELLATFKELDKEDLMDMMIENYREEHAKASSAEAKAKVAADEAQDLKRRLLQSSLSTSVQRSLDESEAKKILADHEEEHQMHLKQLKKEKKGARKEDKSGGLMSYWPLFALSLLVAFIACLVRLLR